MGGVDLVQWEGLDLVIWEGWILCNGRGGSCPMVGVDLVQG